MKRKESLGQLQRLFDSQSLGVLATNGAGAPHTSLVAFACTEDLKGIAFATTRASRKYTNIMSTPNVAMLIDNRNNSISDFKDAVAVTAFGEAREPEKKEKERLMEIYMTKHPYLGDFARSPSIALMVIDVHSYNSVTRFQRVLELRMDV